MTFLLSGMNERFAVQVSDRRLSVNGRMVDDEAAKSFTLVILNVGLVVAFTGLARFKGFDTYAFLQKSIAESGESDFEPANILRRTADRLNEEFSKRPLSELSGSSRKLIISFVGFNCSFDPPARLAAEISNHLGNDRIGPFEVRFTQVTDRHKPFSFLGAFGDARALNVIDEQHLRRVLEGNVSM